MTRVDVRDSAGTDAVVDFVADLSVADVPDVVLERAVDDLSDTLGLLVAGSVETAARRVRDYLAATDQLPGPVELVGQDGSATRTGAALLHGTAIHALDYDDTGHPGNVHPSSHVLPALLSLTAGQATDGEALLLAYLVGLEVENKIGTCLPASVRNLRFHPTGVIGPIAAAMAGSRVLGLDRDGIRMALGIAASMGAGVRANVGSDVKPLHAGRSAASGVEAVLLARHGVLACPAVLDVRYGFLDAFRDNTGDFAGFDRSPLRELGRSWGFEDDFGIALKPFPCCACTHPGIEAALAIATKVRAEDIVSVDVGTSAYALSIVGDPSPDTATQARFSMQYCVAAALVHGRVGLATFVDEAVRDEAVRRVMQAVELHVEDRLRDDLEHPAVVTVTLRNGDRVTDTVPFASGKPARWFRREQLLDKFTDCVGQVLAAEQVTPLYDWAQAIGTRSTIGDLADLARPRSA